jgi:hypothetical protein
MSRATDRRRGAYSKYKVTRLDGTSVPGGKHEKCSFFMLDKHHDKFSAAALLAYAGACEVEFPFLAHDLRVEAMEVAERFGLCSTCGVNPESASNTLFLCRACIAAGVPEWRLKGLNQPLGTLLVTSGRTTASQPNVQVLPRSEEGNDLPTVRLGIVTDAQRLRASLNGLIHANKLDGDPHAFATLPGTKGRPREEKEAYDKTSFIAGGQRMRAEIAAWMKAEAHQYILDGGPGDDRAVAAQIASGLLKATAELIEKMLKWSPLNWEPKE